MQTKHIFVKTISISAFMLMTMSLFASRHALLVMFCMMLILPNQPVQAETEHEQMIVFVQPGLSGVSKVFRNEHLPEIRKIAESMGVSVHLVDARQGAPEAVAITPLIVYQNHRGRSIYQGRTNTPARIRNFIRTSRFVPQGAERNRRANIPIWQAGRERMWAPVKVSPVAGTQPDGYRDRAFVSEALESIARGFKYFQMQKVAELGRADRGFYMDFYPWVSQDGTLFLSLALYSQFHCKEPVFEKKKPPLIGPWKNRSELFQQAAALMEAAVARQIRSPATGDAFEPVAKKLPPVSWDAIGFPLPPPPSQKMALTAVDAKLSQDWILEKPSSDDPPMIQFRFPAPLDIYAGEVKEGTGEFLLPPTLVLDGASGFFEIDTRTAVTMGEPVLDEAIRGSALLNAGAFPAATFVVEALRSNGQPLSYGRLTPADFSGTFTLKGKSVPLSSVAEFEPVIGADGKPRLLIRASFKIDLRTFNIAGADGPAPAKYTLLFDINFKLRAGKPSLIY